jgi:NitT/TauT family transport system substrate-binding protein
MSKSLKQSKYFSGVLVLTLFFGMILSACAQPPAASTETVTLKIAVLPILDALPMYVAEQQGLFEKRGVKVEFIPAASAAERDQVIIAGQADGMINEIVSTILYNKQTIQVQIVRFARTATADTAMYRILAAGNSGINSVDGLKGVSIGISEGTVIEYLTDRLLSAEGFSEDEIKTIAVPSIADRMALLGTGELKAAMLPEPLSSLAVQQGAKVILDDTKNPQFGYSTIAFRKSVIDQHPDAIRAFLAAIEDATAQINADPSKFSSLLTEQKLVPAPLEGSFPVPHFVTASIPDEAQWADVLDWAKQKGMVDQDVSYQDSVTGSFLPK